MASAGTLARTALTRLACYVESFAVIAGCPTGISALAAGTAAGTGHDPTILVAAKTLLPPIDAEALGGLAALLPTPFADQFESLTDALKNYDTARNTLFTDLETGNITKPRRGSP